MKRWAVAVCNLMDNKNEIRVVKADTDIEAIKGILLSMSLAGREEESERFIAKLPNELESLLTGCFDMELSVSKPIAIDFID